MSEPINETQSLVEAPAQDSAEIMRIKNERALAEFSSPFASAAAYRHFMAVANIFAASVFVPAHFKDKPGECLIAIDIARRMNEGELMVMQQMFVVKGNPGFKTKFMIARANRMAGFKSTIKWRKEVLGDPLTAKTDKGSYQIPNISVTAYAVDRFGELIEASVDTTMAIAEGWITNDKYRSMPEHMFRWRSASFLINLYAPEVMMGMDTVEELETMPDLPAMKNVTPVGGGVRALEEKLGAAVTPKEAAFVDAVPLPAVAATVAPAAASDLPHLSAEDVAQLRAMSAERGVSWSAVEEYFGGPLDLYAEAGKDERGLWTLVEDAIDSIARQEGENKAAGSKPTGSLFDDGGGKKARK